MSPVNLEIPRDSNLLYLPLMYFLPEDIILRCPTLRRLPRKVREVIYSAENISVVESDQFLAEIMEAGTALIFPHFGFGGWKEHYTGYCPVYQLSYYIFNPICKLLGAETGWNIQALMNVPSDQEIPFFQPEYIKAVMASLVKCAIEEHDLQPILKVVREMPCDEDFERWDTNVRKDFIRKWYHTRSKRVKMVSLEEYMEDEESSIHAIEDTSGGFEDNVIAEDFCERFKATLSKKDMEILELRVEGRTYEEIARRLGYKNHSGVLKRMNAVKKAFVEYESKYRQ